MAGRGCFCFECLDRRIMSDFAGRFAVSYAVADSALPLASSAVVQISNSDGDTSMTTTSGFMLVYRPADDDDCLNSYINECTRESMEDDGVNINIFLDSSQDQVKVTVHLPDGKINCSNISSVDYRCSKYFGRGMTTSCNHFGYSSCSRTVTSLAPIAYVGISSLSNLEELASNLLSGSLEDHVLGSLSLLIEGKASSRDSVNFLRLLGFPSFEDNNFLGSLRHPNIVPILAMLKASNFNTLVLPTTPYTLESILYYSPNAMKSEWHIKFLLYQLLSALTYLHGLGISHGNICPSSVMLTDSGWSWLRIYEDTKLHSKLCTSNSKNVMGTHEQIGCCTDGCPSTGLFSNLKLSLAVNWKCYFYQWWRGELSNFEYLLVLNRLAGRRWGDRTFHTVMPWVIDFSIEPEMNSDIGWRNLSKSKWRLAKGDEQLDFTYLTSEIPHHVSDECLSELAVCSYKARRLPLSVLRTAVRSVYEPNEYPSTMQRLYQWTPDECIPEFYCDPKIFYSLHDGMPDLAVPSWAGSPEQFIEMHREALESDRVSCKLHQWIDITFGYKMSGEAAIAAKNVMLPSSVTTLPKSVGRRQLFNRPHPKRQLTCRKACEGTNDQSHLTEVEKSHHFEMAYLQELEEASAFVEHARHLDAFYGCYAEKPVKDISSEEEVSIESVEKSTNNPCDFSTKHQQQADIDVKYLLEHVEVDDEGSLDYQELLLWKCRLPFSSNCSENIAWDIFSFGCLFSELYLKRPLFDSTTLSMYLESGILPGLIEELPAHVKLLVEACIHQDWTRWPSAKNLLESPFFPATIKSCYLFLSPLQLLAKDGTRLCYAANFAKQGVLKAMGSFAAEMCAPYCLPLVLSPLTDDEAEWAYMLLKEFIKCLMPTAVKTLLLPAIQNILQVTGYSHLKVTLLQDSFMRDIWNSVGKQVYLETIHPLVLSNLVVAPCKSSAAAAAVLLIGSSEELGAPKTINQTILPLINCFGKGLCSDGIDALVRIGGLLGETFIVRHMLPLLKSVVSSCINYLSKVKPEPVQSWCAMAVIDCLTTLDGLVVFLPRKIVAKELIGDQNFLHVAVLMEKNFEIPVLQVAANTLMAVCQRIGPDMTALHVLPQLKELFDELAFSQEITYRSNSLGRNMEISKRNINRDGQIDSRMDLVFLLYPSFASLLGIEKLRQCCATWLLLEQYLFRFHSWKWEYTGESSRNGSENVITKKDVLRKSSTCEYNPAKLLLNGVGWSIPQSQGAKSAKNLMPQRRLSDASQGPIALNLPSTNFLASEAWFWYPSPAVSWDGPEFPGRAGGLKDEPMWKIKASVIHSVRAHHGALRSLAVGPDEQTIYTAGSGPGFKGTVQKWELTSINCVSDYCGHEEVVNDICVLASSGRVASCDGTLHVWNSQTGKLISIFAESSVDSAHLMISLSSVLKINADQTNMIGPNSLSSGILTSTFDGSLYTCMNQLGLSETLVVGTGNGSLRFIDVARGQKLHLWRGDSVDSNFPSLVSALCSSGSDKMSTEGGSALSSWIASGLSSGRCRLFDARSGKVIASWRAHDGYVTQLAAPEDYLLVSSSLDRTLRVWDLRRNLPSKPIVYKGHSDGISGFSLWGQDVISISRNKIGVTSLSKHASEEGYYRVVPRKLYLADQGTRNLSVLTCVNILPYSRLFVVGTEDGYLRICC